MPGSSIDVVALSMPPSRDYRRAIVANQSEPGAASKASQEDLQSLREKYLRIMEEQVIKPLRRELHAHRERMRGREAGAHVEKIDDAIALLDDGMGELRSMSLGEIRTAFAGRSTRG